LAGDVLLAATRKKYLTVATDFGAQRRWQTQPEVTFVTTEIGHTRSVTELHLASRWTPIRGTGSCDVFCLVSPRIWCGFMRTSMKKATIACYGGVAVATMAKASTP